MGLGATGNRAEDFQTVLRSAGGTEATHENIEDLRPWISVSDRGRNCCIDIFLFIVISTAYITKFSICLFYNIFCLLGLFFASLIRISVNPYDLLQLFRISEGLLYRES
jgi:hypothetical protein